MNAKLAAWGTLLMADKMTMTEYAEKLHTLFLQNPEDERLLQLENSTANEKDTLAILLAAAEDFTEEEKQAYAKTILSPLAETYRSNRLTLAEFDRIAMQLWRAIPKSIADAEPFVLLTAASDYLGSESAVVARSYYEQTFSYYDPTPEEEAAAKFEQPAGIRAGMRAYWKQCLRKPFWGMMIAFFAIAALFAVIFSQNTSAMLEFLDWFMEEKSHIFASAETTWADIGDELQLSTSGLFFNNLLACGMGAALGLIPFLFLSLLTMAFNAAIIGVTVGGMLGLGVSPLWAAGSLIPHGIFEIPAMMFSWSLGFALCRSITRKIRRRADVRPMWAIKQTLLYLTLVVLPLLIIAAIVESKLTPIVAGWLPIF